MEEINFYDLVKYYVKNWLNIVIAVMIGGIIGVGYTYFIQKPLYESKATLLVVDSQRTSAQESVVINNYVGLFTSHRVLSPVINEQDYDGNYDKLLSNTEASNKKGTDIINVAISTNEAKKSRAMLEGAIESFRSQANELYGDSSVRVKVVDNANTPEQPSNVKPLVQVGLAVAAAVAVTIIAMFFVYDYKNSNQPKASAKKSLAAKATPTKKNPAATKTKAAVAKAKTSTKTTKRPTSTKK